MAPRCYVLCICRASPPARSSYKSSSLAGQPYVHACAYDKWAGESARKKYCWPARETIKARGLSVFRRSRIEYQPVVSSSYEEELRAWCRWFKDCMIASIIHIYYLSHREVAAVTKSQCVAQLRAVGRCTLQYAPTWL